MTSATTFNSVLRNWGAKGNLTGPKRRADGSVEYEVCVTKDTDFPCVSIGTKVLLHFAHDPNDEPRMGRPRKYNDRVEREDAD